MSYSYAEPDTKQIGGIEEVAKKDPAKAAKDYKLRKGAMVRSYLIISKLPNTSTLALGHLTRHEEKVFLTAIKEIK